MGNILSISNLSKTYGPLKAINNLSLVIEQGQVFGLLGPNGSGKTTTLGIILGAIHATKGTYEWFSNKDKSKNRRRIGALLEQPNFYPWLSAELNLKISCTVRGAPSSSIEPCLKKTGLWDYRKEPAGNFSLGMKQRLGLAATLLGDPDVLVLDEPTNGIDAQGMFEIRNIILDVASSGKTIILASHLLSEVEKVCSHVAVLKKGSVIATGAISNVLKPDDEIEISAENMEALATCLKTFPKTKKMNRHADMIQVAIDKNVKASEVNKYLVEHGIFADHLSRKKLSLENYFIKLLENDK